MAEDAVAEVQRRLSLHKAVAHQVAAVKRLKQEFGLNQEAELSMRLLSSDNLGEFLAGGDVLKAQLQRVTDPSSMIVELASALDSNVQELLHAVLSANSGSANEGSNGDAEMEDASEQADEDVFAEAQRRLKESYIKDRDVTTLPSDPYLSEQEPPSLGHSPTALEQAEQAFKTAEEAPSEPAQRETLQHEAPEGTPWLPPPVPSPVLPAPEVQTTGEVAVESKMKEEATEEVPAPKRLSWVKEEELDEEEMERLRVQATRNVRMREKLRQRREQKQVEPEIPGLDFEEFMAVSQTSAKKSSVNESLPPWFESRGYIESCALRLHEELLDFMKFMRHSDEEVEARRGWVRTIGNTCRTLWPNCQIRVFGSFFTSLSLPNGDVDVAILDVPCKPATAMKILADRMLENGEISWLEIIESAKVPVAKLRSQSCGLRADVVINQPDGVRTSQFIRDRCKEYPQMRPLLIFLKYFLMQRGLHETYTGGMGSYLLCNVVLHFLQRHPARKDDRQYAATSLGHFLFDFLKYYGREFNYDYQAISLLDGGRVFNKSERGKGGKGGAWKGGKGKGGPALCLESPLDPSIDLGAPCYRLSVLKNLFHHGYHCLAHLFSTKAPPDSSMICPFLLDPGHPVITERHKLMAEQPVALPGMKRASDFVEAVKAEGGLPDLEDGPPAKRQKISDSDVAPADGFVPLAGSDEAA